MAVVNGLLGHFVEQSRSRCTQCWKGAEKNGAEGVVDGKVLGLEAGF